MSEQAAKLRRMADELLGYKTILPVLASIAAELEALASEPSPVVGEDAGPVYVAEPARKESPEEAALFRVRSNLPAPAAMIPVAQVEAFLERSKLRGKDRLYFFKPGEWAELIATNAQPAPPAAPNLGPGHCNKHGGYGFQSDCPDCATPPRTTADSAVVAADACSTQPSDARDAVVRQPNPPEPKESGL